MASSNDNESLTTTLVRAVCAIDDTEILAAVNEARRHLKKHGIHANEVRASFIAGEEPDEGYADILSESHIRSLERRVAELRLQLKVLQTPLEVSASNDDSGLDHWAEKQLIFDLGRGGGLNAEEIARSTGWDPRSVRMRLQRITKKYGITLYGVKHVYDGRSRFHFTM
jgi:hypothetical protein